MQSYFENNPYTQKEKANNVILKIAKELGFDSIQLADGQNEWPIGEIEPEGQYITRNIIISPKLDDHYQNIEVRVHHPDISKLIVDKRNQVLFPVVIGLILFGFFLIWAIRSMVHRPLEKLLDATQAISDGKTDLRLDTSRQDEFGYIARFFNEMLDQLLEQQEQLKFAVKEAKNANSAKSSFLANMSHELRTPLNAIIGYSDLLVEQANDLQRLESIPDLHKIRTAGAYLLDLISNILDLTKIEAGKTDIYYENVNIESMIDEIKSTMQPMVEKNKNKLIVEMEENIGDVRTDYTKLRQSIFNLLSNACKFTEEGEITLRVYRHTYNIKEKLIIEVIDTGAGMSNECLYNLFTPFERGKNSTALKISGTGLGLTISRHFCNLLDGEISVESDLGIGTVFKIHLPYIKADAGNQNLPLASTGSR